MASWTLPPAGRQLSFSAVSDRIRPSEPRGPAIKLSARNQLPGKVTEVHKGPTTARLKIDIGGGVIVTSSITTEAVDDLGLKIGDQVHAIIKASDVMVGK